MAKWFLISMRSRVQKLLSTSSGHPKGFLTIITWWMWDGRTAYIWGNGQILKEVWIPLFGKKKCHSQIWNLMLNMLWLLTYWFWKAWNYNGPRKFTNSNPSFQFRYSRLSQKKITFTNMKFNVKYVVTLNLLILKSTES